MHIIANILWLVGVLYALAWGVQIRHKAKTERGTERIFEVHALLLAVSVILIPILSLSPFHLLWMLPASFLLGLVSLIFPFSLLWPLASFYGSLWYIGIKPRETNRKQSEITLIKDSEWSVIDGEPCRVIDFTPWGSVKDGKVSALSGTTPYASIAIECKKIPEKITGFITHKMDFLHLWAAFKERTIKQNEEVIIFWSKKHYKVKLLKFFPGFWPKLWIMVCQKGAYEIMTNQNYKPELQGEARYNAEKPIIEWKPEIME